MNAEKTCATESKKSLKIEKNVETIKALIYEPLPTSKQVSHGACEVSDGVPLSNESPLPIGRDIRICTRVQMKKVCPPKLCDCPATYPPLTSKQKWMKGLKFAGKIGLFVFALKWSIDEKIWDSQDATVQLGYRYMEFLKNFFSVNRPDPRTDYEKYDMMRIHYNLKTVWNYLLISSASGIENIVNRIDENLAYYNKLPESKIDSKAGKSNKSSDDEAFGSPKTKTAPNSTDDEVQILIKKPDVSNNLASLIPEKVTEDGKLVCENLGVNE